MDISISLISSDRFFSKAFTKCHALVQAVEDILCNDIESSKSLELWFVDKDATYCEVVKENKEFIEIHFGRDLAFDYRPMAGGDIHSKIKEELSSQVTKAVTLLCKTEDEAMKMNEKVSLWYNS
ncbi:hypothetical protein ACJJI3_10410 [Microbulbifer sp. ZKSA004]|uniref:hypothetical protein n=1 Tax=Microbulbifer sp. ZKSA004 TaxID=3243389 RepID=UPI004039D06B